MAGRLLVGIFLAKIKDGTFDSHLKRIGRTARDRYFVTNPHAKSESSYPKYATYDRIRTKSGWTIKIQFHSLEFYDERGVPRGLYSLPRLRKVIELMRQGVGRDQIESFIRGHSHGSCLDVEVDQYINIAWFCIRDGLTL